MSDQISDTNLGARLRAIHENKQAAALKREEARKRIAYEQGMQDRAAILRFWLKYVDYITTEINRGVEPKGRKVPGVFIHTSYYSLDENMHPHHDIWQEMQAGAAALGLELRLTYCHDGMGVNSWRELMVYPLT